VPDHQWNSRSLFLGKRQEMGGEVTTDIAVERYQI
jgi:hypothetical protein